MHLCKSQHACNPRQGSDHAQSFAKKTNTLANALHQQGRSATALQRLGTAAALLAQLPGPPPSLLWLVQSFVNIRAACQQVKPAPSQPIKAARQNKGSRIAGRAREQKSVLSNMQADAAVELPVSATVAAYLQQRQPTVEAVLLGRVLAMELKALHQVCECQYAQHILQLIGPHLASQHGYCAKRVQRTAQRSTALYIM